MIQDELDLKEESDQTAAPAGEMTETEIDENLRASFPASDPPSWTLGSDHREAVETENPDTGRDAK